MYNNYYTWLIPVLTFYNNYYTSLIPVLTFYPDLFYLATEHLGIYKNKNAVGKGYRIMLLY